MPIHYQEHRFETPDGWGLSLWRSRPISADGSRRPVLLLHGVGANRFAFGVVRDASLPAVLNAHGRDTWLLEFRGNRSSRPPRSGSRRHATVDDKLHVDLPAAIEEIRGLTGAARVDLVGHSLGGVLTYLHCGGPHGEQVGRAVTLAAPANFEAMLGALRPLLRGPARALAPVARLLPGLGVDHLARFPGPIPHLVALRHHVRPRGLDRNERRLYLDHAIEDMVGGDLAQMMNWCASGRLQSNEGHDYGWRLAACRTPIRLLASATDSLIPIAGVREAFALLGSDEKDLHVVARDRGSTRDYAHADLLLSRHALSDVHPHVLDWLERDAGSEPAGQATPRSRGGLVG